MHSYRAQLNLFLKRIERCYSALLQTETHFPITRKARQQVEDNPPRRGLTCLWRWIFILKFSLYWFVDLDFFSREYFSTDSLLLLGLERFSPFQNRLPRRHSQVGFLFFQNPASLPVISRRENVFTTLSRRHVRVPLTSSWFHHFHFGAEYRTATVDSVYLRFRLYTLDGVINPHPGRPKSVLTSAERLFDSHPFYWDK